MKTAFIDWQENRLNIFIFDKQGSRYNLADSTSLPIEGELNSETLASSIKSDIDTVFLSLPLSMLTLREQTFPFSDTDKIKDTITYELEGILLGHIDDYSIEHIIIETVDSGSKVLAVCLENSKLNEIINIFSSAGLEPKVITAIDLRISEGSTDKLFEEPVADTEIRSAAAGNEISTPLINLRQGRHAFTGDVDRLKKTINLTAVLVLILLLVLGIVSSLRFMDARDKNNSLAKQLQAEYKRVFPEDKKVVNVERQFQGNINALKRRKEALAGIPLLDILNSISLKTSDNITLSEFNADGNNMTLRGIAQSFEDVETLKNDLSTSYESVKVTDSNATGDKKVDFTIIMKDKTA